MCANQYTRVLEEIISFALYLLSGPQRTAQCGNDVVPSAFAGFAGARSAPATPPACRSTTKAPLPPMGGAVLLLHSPTTFHDRFRHDTKLCFNAQDGRIQITGAHPLINTSVWSSACQKPGSCQKEYFQRWDAMTYVYMYEWHCFVISRYGHRPPLCSR